MFMEPKIYGPIDHVEVCLEYQNSGSKFLVITLEDLPGLRAMLNEKKDGVQAAEDAFQGCAGIPIPVRVRNHVEKAQAHMEAMFKLALYKAVEDHLLGEMRWGGLGRADEDDLVEMDICLKENSYECYLSADGYLDRTESQLFDTVEEVHIYFDETYNILKCPTHSWQEFDDKGCHSCQSDKEEENVERGLKTMDTMEVADTPGMTVEDLI